MSPHRLAEGKVCGARRATGLLQRQRGSAQALVAPGTRHAYRKHHVREEGRELTGAGLREKGKVGSSSGWAAAWQRGSTWIVPRFTSDNNGRLAPCYAALEKQALGKLVRGRKEDLPTRCDADPVLGGPAPVPRRALSSSAHLGRDV